MIQAHVEMSISLFMQICFLQHERDRTKHQVLQSRWDVANNIFSLCFQKLKSPNNANRTHLTKEKNEQKKGVIPPKE